MHLVMSMIDAYEDAKMHGCRFKRQQR